MDNHTWQQHICQKLKRPILNVGCKEDPARLGELFDAVNLDINDYDPHTGVSGKDIKNFIKGDARQLPWKRPAFMTVVIGEVIEHCTFDAAKVVLLEAKRVLLPKGRVVLTFPLDPRPKEVQHDPKHLVEWCEGITSWHQTVWEDDLLASLMKHTDFKIETRTNLDYPFVRNHNPEGLGLVLSRRVD